ncbi:hypothetical protein TNCT_423191 [Trichonephila clavata]|uniref:Uncharacterized protein n=1 Tax=Trichonephila clavata TaxID=2740835 RepID=A0A8X6K905_TRICU|nr:hypothetical protein TNCT_423191 [Trichonephila clavata]
MGTASFQMGAVVMLLVWHIYNSIIYTFTNVFEGFSKIFELIWQHEFSYQLIVQPSVFGSYAHKNSSELATHFNRLECCKITSKDAESNAEFMDNICHSELIF